MRALVEKVFRQVWREQKEDLPFTATDDTVLLDMDMDSLAFAVIVTRLEEELGYDPFTIVEEPVYPVTLGEFIRFYESTPKPQ